MTRASNGEQRQRVLDRVSEIVPLLRERAAASEAARRLPEAVVDALVSSGLHRAYQPVRYGGYELDYAFQVELGNTLAQGCASAAWCGVFYAQHPLVVGMMTPDAQDDVWGATPDTLIANAFFTPATTCTQVAGGYVLDGTWIISSGVDYCGWNNLNVMVSGDGRQPEHRFMLVPKDDYRILNDWHATGLCGTGSNGIVLDSVFRPRAPHASHAGLQGRTDAGQCGQRFLSLPSAADGDLSGRTCNGCSGYCHKHVGVYVRRPTRAAERGGRPGRRSANRTSAPVGSGG